MSDPDPRRHANADAFSVVSLTGLEDIRSRVHSDIPASLPLRLANAVIISAERAAPCCKCAEGQQEVGGLRRITGAGRELRGALRRDKARVAVLPSLELAIEKGAPRRVVGERRQVGIHAGNKAPGAIYAAASFWLRGDMSSVFRRHPASGQPSAAIREMTTSRSSKRQLHFVAGSQPADPVSASPGKCYAPAPPIGWSRRRWASQSLNASCRGPRRCRAAPA